MSYMQNETNGTESTINHQATILPVCSICNQVPRRGIKGVIHVGKAWICWLCEREIMLLEVGSPAYGVMMEKMRKIWK